jgi:hypothetical protein
MGRGGNDTMPVDEELRDRIFALGPQVRYVAFGDRQRVSTAQRDRLAGASDETSDFFEELLVNPTLLTLVRQRGELDCGGLSYLIVGYGNFHQVVVPAPGRGHVSVCVELDANPNEVANRVIELVTLPTSDPEPG